jgi:hypothetical protein
MKVKRKFVLYTGIHEENETRWDETEQEWVSVLDKRGKPIFRKYAVDHNSDQPVVVESHLDLCKLFANKFREVLPEPERIEGPMGPPQPMTSDGRPPAAEFVKATTPTNLGREVTETFKGAVDANVKIFEDKGKFVIAEANGDLYDDGVRLSRKEVEKLLSDLVPA